MSHGTPPGAGTPPPTRWHHARPEPSSASRTEYADNPGRDRAVHSEQRGPADRVGGQRARKARPPVAIQLRNPVSATSRSEVPAMGWQEPRRTAPLEPPPQRQSVRLQLAHSPTQGAGDRGIPRRTPDHPSWRRHHRGRTARYCRGDGPDPPSPRTEGLVPLHGSAAYTTRGRQPPVRRAPGVARTSRPCRRPLDRPPRPRRDPKLRTLTPAQYLSYALNTYRVFLTGGTHATHIQPPLRTPLTCSAGSSLVSPPTDNPQT